MPFIMDATEWKICSRYLKSFLFEPARDPSTNIGQTEMVKTARFMLGEIFLGGLLQDDWDKRILRTLVSGMMTQSMFSGEPQEFLGGFRMPEEGSHQAFVASIQEIPETDSSALLGLSCNADHLHRIESCQQMIACLSNLLPQVHISL